MRLYPGIPLRRANAVTRDAATIVLALLGLWVYRTVDRPEVLGRGVHDAARAHAGPPRRPADGRYDPLVAAIAEDAGSG
jgi:hypothetical protein